MVCLFIGDINTATTKKEIQTCLNSYGRCTKLQVKVNKRKKAKMCFFHVQDYQTIKALITRPVIINNSEHYCQLSQVSDGEVQTYDFQRNCIFVNNIPRQMNDHMLFNFFSSYGFIDSAFSIKKNGVSKGYGFVYFKHQSAAEYVARLGKIKFEGKFMIVQIYQQKGKPSKHHQARNKMNIQIQMNSQNLTNNRNSNKNPNEYVIKKDPYHHGFEFEALRIPENCNIAIQKSKKIQQFHHQPFYGQRAERWIEEKRAVFRRYDKPNDSEIYGTQLAAVGISKLDLVELNHSFSNLRLNRYETRQGWDGEKESNIVIGRSRIDQSY